MLNYSLFFDGGCLGNGSFGQGYGSYEIKDENENIVWSENRIQFGGGLTSNIAEYLALIHCIDKLIEINKNRINPINNKDITLNIWSDSNLLVNQVNGKWKCKNNNLKKLLGEVKEKLKQFKKFSIKWHGRDNNMVKFGH